MLLVNRMKPRPFTSKLFEVCIASGELFIFDDVNADHILRFSRYDIQTISLVYIFNGTKVLISARRYHLTTQNVLLFKATAPKSAPSFFPK